MSRILSEPMGPTSLLRVGVVVAMLGEPVEAQGSPASVGEGVHDAAGTRFIELIERHPMAELRHELWRLIAMDCLWVYTVGETDPLLTVMNRLAAVCYEPRECCENLCPTLYVSARFLLRSDRPDAWRMSILWHEYVHIRHVEQNLARPLRCGEPLGSSIEDVAAMLGEELRAHESQYLLAAFLGEPPYDLKDRIYRRRGRSAMACFLAEEYAELPSYRDHVEGLWHGAAAFTAAMPGAPPALDPRASPTSARGSP